MKKTGNAYADLGTLIELMGQYVKDTGRQAGFMVETEEKADRYLQKLAATFGIHEVSRGAGPIKGSILVIIALKPVTVM